MQSLNRDEFIQNYLPGFVNDAHSARTDRAQKLIINKSWILIESLNKRRAIFGTYSQGRIDERPAAGALLRFKSLLVLVFERHSDAVRGESRDIAIVPSYTGSNHVQMVIFCQLMPDPGSKEWQVDWLIRHHHHGVHQAVRKFSFD
jgi:hypothetical protein